MKKTTALIIMDGFGIAPAAADNAITTQGTPRIDALMAKWPNTTIAASGMAVGLPEGQMGNSEVGHVNIGAGRIVYQELTRITKAIHDGDFFTRPALVNLMNHLVQTGGALHCMGLISDGGVHSHVDHLLALVDMAKKSGVKQAYVHCFLDGRDVPPTSGADFVAELQKALDARGYGKIATVMGRYYAMDRDNRWERVQLAYDAMTQGRGVAADDAVAAIRASYADEVNDEFVLPVVIQSAGAPVATIGDGDGVCCFNFRPDRAREITRCFIQDDFSGFDRATRPTVKYVSMTQYDETFTGLAVAFVPEGRMANTFGEYLGSLGLTQLRIAETEKYAHVTFFFNGGVEEAFPGEDRALIASPKVATYDLQPEMSAYEVADEAVARINSGKYDAIILNFANADMVGHTGVQPAAQAAIAAVDACVAKVVEALLAVGGQCIITADHGNAEQMWDAQNNVPYTAHTVSNPVPCIVVSDKAASLRQDGVLADLAPTLLELMGLAQPAEMTGKTLLAKG